MPSSARMLTFIYLFPFISAQCVYYSRYLLLCCNSILVIFCYTWLLTVAFFYLLWYFAAQMCSLSCSCDVFLLNNISLYSSDTYFYMKPLLNTNYAVIFFLLSWLIYCVDILYHSCSDLTFLISSYLHRNMARKICLHNKVKFVWTPG